MSVRTFIAIEIPHPIKESIIHTIEPIKTAYPKVSWTRAEAYHLTLKFLGDVDEEMIDPIGDAIKKITGNYSPFELIIKGLGVFPNKRSPRVLWAGIKMPEDSVARMQKEMEEALFQLGFARENRKFKPHLTLGRVKRRMPPQFSEEFLNCVLQAQPFNVDKIVLMKSDLKPTGAVYTPLKIIELNNI